MIGLLRSNLFRLFKSKGFWLLLIIEIIALGFFLKLNIPYEINWHGEHETRVDGVSINMYVMIVNLVFMIAFCFWISGIVGENFSSGTLSHKLTAGNSRLKIYLAELLSVLIACLALYIFYYGFSLLFCLPAGDEYFKGGYAIDVWDGDKYVGMKIVYSEFQQLVNNSVAGMISTMGLCSLIVCLRMCWQSRGADIIIKLIPFIVLAFGFLIYQLDPPSGAHGALGALLKFLFGINLLFLPTPYFTDRLFWHYSFYPFIAWWYAIAAAVVTAVTVTVGVLCINRIDLHLAHHSEEE